MDALCNDDTQSRQTEKPESSDEFLLVAQGRLQADCIDLDITLVHSITVCPGTEQPLRPHEVGYQRDIPWRRRKGQRPVLRARLMRHR